MNLFAEYRHHILAAVEQILPGLKTDAITLEPPRDASHGDLSTNAAMVLTKQVGQPPRAIAEKLAEKLRALEGVAEVSIAGPGFINIRLHLQVWQEMLGVILREGTTYGNTALGEGRRINVEYVSANPTGPLHIGHARGAVYGDAIARLLLKAGYSVTKEYYVNDAGAQVEVLADSVLLRYREACGEAIGDIPAGLYPGEYLKYVGETLKQMHGRGLLDHPLAHQRAEAKQTAIDAMLAMIKQDLHDLDIHHDIFTSEAKIHADRKVDQAIEKLRAAGHVYRGVLEPPKGEVPEEWEPQEQLLFRATEFGDDADRTIEKADGTRTYFAGDFGLTLDKIQRGFDTLIYMLGADHGGYVKRLEAMTAALSDRTVAVDVKLCQLVHLTKGGEPVKMSKRAGNFVTVRDVLDEVGKDILRFVMLMRKTNADMEFDLEKVKEQSKDNPVFYVQYAHARAKSVLRLAAEQAPEAYALLNSSPFKGEAGWGPQGDASLVSARPHPNPPPIGEGIEYALLSHPAEMALIKLLAGWPRLIEQAAVAHEPHRIIYYLQEVAGAFHGLWNVGQKAAEIRIVQPDQPALTAARLALARAMTVVLASGLTTCGVEPVEELR